MDGGLLSALIGFSTVAIVNVGAFLYSFGRLSQKVDGNKETLKEVKAQLASLAGGFTDHLRSHGG